MESVDLYHVRMRLRAPFETSFGVEHDRDAILLRLRSDIGEGWGECVAGNFPGYSYETVDTAWHILESFFLPAVLGQDLRDVEAYRAAISAYKGHPLARAGLELALWDVLARAKGLSLARMLGGKAAKVPVGVSVGIQPDTSALVRTVADFVQAGYRRVKLKIKPGRDVDDVAAVRAAFPDLALQVDANSAYTLDDAPVFEAMDSFGLLLIEQPLAEDDILDHAELQARLETPICLDESILSVRHARQALDCGACRVINIKPARLGGLREAVGVHDLCQARGIPVWCGGMLETGIGRASNLALASLPGFVLPGDISASDRYYAEDIARPRFVLNNGSTIDVPQGPGLGVEVDEDALRRFTLRHQKFGV
ncbi:MAG TPA: o-succinylbenzoate synthase [Anaerolineales bacterium]|nr:o-succinylbenzoate synthase [Anaerolineales bacterium]